MRSCSTEKGFTLIELLVVIAIIGILASVVLASLNTAREKSRDALRLSQMKEIQKALEVYYSEHGRYPSTLCPNARWTSFDSPQYKPGLVCNAPSGTSLGTIATALQNYIKAPEDPKGLGTDAGYLYRADSGADYCLLLYRNPENMKNYPASMVVTSRCGTVGSNGQCSGTNAIYIGTGVYAGGC